MGVIADRSIKKKFLKHFAEYKKEGYDDLIEFPGDEVGFSLKKTYPGKDEITLLKVALIDNTETKSNVYIDATYGKLNEDSSGLIVRNSDNIKLRDPIDIVETGSFSYEVESDTLSEADQVVSGVEALNEVYEKHIKPTKKYGGILLRLRLWYWRIALKDLVSFVSNLLTSLLIIIAGIRYQYEPFFDEEKIDRLAQKLDPKLVKESETSPINFFGYEVNKWTIIFYCLLHLALFFIFYFFNIHAAYLSQVFTNNFLTAIYVVASLWLVEFVIPLLLMKAIKKLSTIVINLEFKKIEI